ncbi:hypothetical protein EDC01DRAFT_651928 [Geopyxis carbonaria]|nr:hypothetical protein EDC01DRAFT_651928 [Geopyxis carbonaria]
MSDQRGRGRGRRYRHRDSPVRVARRTLAATTVSTTIPSLLRADSRAATGVSSSILYTPDTLPPLPSSTSQRALRFAISPTDTYAAAHTLLPRRVAVLNMASAFKPGGGFLNGSKAQEESLCMRSTLHAALPKAWYPLPEVCCAHTKDVCVFRSPESEMEEGVGSKWYVDVLSAAAVCRPSRELVGTAAYRALWREKMRCVLRTAVEGGAEVVVLGAWGCGAYRNPVAEVVAAWKEVLGERTWGNLEEVMFAVLERNMAEEFAALWGEGIEWRETGDVLTQVQL